MPLADRPIIDVIIRQLVGSGVQRIDVSVGYLGSLLEGWIRHEGDHGVRIEFVYEQDPLGTAGALRLVEPAQEPFLAMNGDILTTVHFADLLERHRTSGAIATVAVKDRSVQVEYGVVHTDATGNVERLEEKPLLNYRVSMGVYAFEPAIVELIEEGERLDFPDLLLRARDRGHTVATYPFDGYWRDIGNADDYAQAVADFAEDQSRFLDA